MATVYDIALDFRKQLLAGDRAAQAEMLAHYADAYSKIEGRIAALLAEVAANGGAATEGQLVRLARWKDLTAALDGLAKELATTVGDKITRQQLAALRTANRAAEAQIKALMPADWQHFYQPFPLDAMQQVAGFTGDGTPLADVLHDYGQAASKAIRQELVRAVGSGTWAQTAARTIKNQYGVSATRALALARTETMRAYREGNRAAYHENKDVVAGYQWLSARNHNTCPACLAMDGTFFANSEPMPAHVNCRCVPVPVIRGRAEPIQTTGPEWFDKQPEDFKRKVLGDKGYDAYRNGARLQDFLHMRHDDTWGDQALWRVPGQFVATPPKKARPVPPAPAGKPTLPNGLLANPNDAMAAAGSEYAKWLGNKPDSVDAKYEWLQSLGLGKRSIDRQELVGGVDGKTPSVTPAKKQLAHKAMQYALDDLPDFAPHVLDQLRQSRPTIDLYDDEDWRRTHPGELSYRASAGVGFLAPLYGRPGPWLNMGTESNITTYAHEYLHHVEDVLHLADRHAAWVLQRATGPQQPLSVLTGWQGYRPNETAYPDTFLNPYVGKPYAIGAGNQHMRPGEDYYGTEVLTMGGQQLVTERTAKWFIENYEDHFWLVMAALLGK